MFEGVFYRYCDRKRLPLTEKSGSRTLNGVVSASGLLHESDAVIATPDINVHLELKHLEQAVPKLDLVSFNQKGLDFLASENLSVRLKPLYRVLVTGTPAGMSARIFAAQWGIILIEPNRLPLLVIHALIKGMPAHSLTSLEQRTLREIPSIVVPAQVRLRQLASLLNSDQSLVSATRLDWIFDVQDREGARYWRTLDVADPTWIEHRYEEAVGEYIYRGATRAHGSVAGAR